MTNTSSPLDEIMAKAKARGQKPAPPQPSLDKAILPLVDWLERDLPPADPLLGHWLTTTSRVLIPAPTGLGKSMLAIALGMRVAAGFPFLRWEGRRQCNVLYIDGEMSNRLLKQRLVDEHKRLGVVPAGFHALSHEDVENFAPLNTPEGQNLIEAAIAKVGGAELVIFDNVISLLAGNMKETEQWAATIPCPPARGSDRRDRGPRQETPGPLVANSRLKVLRGKCRIRVQNLGARADRLRLAAGTHRRAASLPRHARTKMAQPAGAAGTCADIRWPL
jgi:hypothetical protein